jgi:hypothetical protein
MPRPSVLTVGLWQSSRVPTTDSQTWSNRRLQGVLGAYLGLLAVIFFAGAANLSPTSLRVTSGILGAASVALLVRILVGCSITSRPAQVEVRGYFRTRRYDWVRIAHFDVLSGTVGLYQRKILGATLNDGTAIKWSFLNDRGRGQGWIDAAAVDLNARLIDSHRPAS